MLVDRNRKSAPWSQDDLATLRKLTGLEVPMKLIARRLDRPVELVRQKAHRVAMADMMRWPPPPQNQWMGLSVSRD